MGSGLDESARDGCYSPASRSPTSNPSPLREDAVDAGERPEPASVPSNTQISTDYTDTTEDDGKSLMILGHLSWITQRDMSLGLSLSISV